LGVRYVLEGRVRKAGNRVRITGQLIDTATSAHIWADRFDGALGDIFDLQDQIASSVAAAIEPKLRQSEIDRAVRKRTESLSATTSTCVRSHSSIFGPTTVLLKLSLSSDGLWRSIPPMRPPRPWSAGVGQCSAFTGGARYRTTTLPRLFCCRGRRSKRHARIRIRCGRRPTRCSRGEASMAEAMLDRAVTLTPNAAMGWNAKGNVLALRNRPDAAIEALERRLI
jgi:hypothetical protein